MENYNNSDSLSEQINNLLINIKRDGKLFPIQSVGEKYPTFVYKKAGEFGVIIPAEYKESLNERFRSCRIRTGVHDSLGQCLILSCSEPSLIDPFSMIASIFVYPGKDGERRQKLLDNPALQWEEWIALFGNSFHQKQPYTVLAELLAYEQVVALDSTAQWNGPLKATHDIETEKLSIEVKATTMRNNWEVVMHGLYQAQSDKPLYLVIYRMEKNSGTESISEVLSRLSESGVDMNRLWEDLERIGYEKGEMALEEKYSVLEYRIFAVNELFPKITLNSFKEGQPPTSISHISYTAILNQDQLDSYSNYSELLG